MKTFLKTLFFFLLMTQISFAQWYQQNSGTTRQLLGVSFSDSNNGIVVGVTGTILRTINGGTTWTTQTSGTTTYLLDVSFSDENNGTAVGYEGTILHTTNGGTNWTTQTSGITSALFSVSFSDANNGTVVGSKGVILRTTNGGINWTTQTSGTTTGLMGVSFSDANNGTAVGGEGVILRTTNGGTTWTTQTSGTTTGLTGVSFSDANHGTAVGFSNKYGLPQTQGIILRTTDGGQNWNYQLETTTELYGVYFTDAYNGTVVGGGIILRTVDGGTTWTTQISGTTDLYEVSFTDANNGTAVGDEGIIIRTTNGGVPVELTSFSVLVNSKEVTLNWSAATELNNQGFEIQRKFGSNDFVTIGSVKGHGTTTSPNNYTYVDKLIDAGKYFYRLKQIDYGGKYEYSAEVEVNWSPFITYKLEQNYPNQFNATTKIGFGISEKGNVRLSVLNILGEEVNILLNEEKETGYHSIDFNASDLPSGVYFYRIKSGNFIDTKKMTLLK